MLLLRSFCLMMSLRIGPIQTFAIRGKSRADLFKLTDVFVEIL